MDSSAWTGIATGFISAVVFFWIDRALSKKIKSESTRFLTAFAITIALAITASLTIKLIRG